MISVTAYNILIQDKPWCDIPWQQAYALFRFIEMQWSFANDSDPRILNLEC